MAWCPNRRRYSQLTWHMEHGIESIRFARGICDSTQLQFSRAEVNAKLRRARSYQGGRVQ